MQCVLFIVVCNVKLEVGIIFIITVIFWGIFPPKRIKEHL